MVAQGGIFSTQILELELLMKTAVLLSPYL
jgi:hypothetical protein